MGVVSKILIAEHHTVLIEARGEQSNPPLKIMVDADAHGGGVPVVAEFVLNGASVSRSGDEAAGLAGTGIALLQRKGAEGTFSNIYAVGIGIILGAGAGVLQIVFSVILGHEGPLDIGLAHAEEHGRHGFGRVAAEIFHARREFNIDKILQANWNIEYNL